jgi:hypothetical protein
MIDLSHKLLCTVIDIGIRIKIYLNGYLIEPSYIDSLLLQDFIFLIRFDSCQILLSSFSQLVGKNSENSSKFKALSSLIEPE